MSTDSGFELPGLAGEPIYLSHLSLSNSQQLHSHIHTHSDVYLADLHLAENTPKLNTAFLSLLEQLTQLRPDRIYLMGDWFDAWLGEDIERVWFAPIAAALKALSDQSRIYVLPGNRDFAITQQFLTPLGAQLIADPFIIQEPNQTTLLSHGDRYCTDDLGYQRLKKVLTNPLILRLLRASPKRFRLWLAKLLRSQSRSRTRIKAESIMDVNPQAIKEQFNQQSGQVLIHGHTHRPALHRVGLCARVVLGDWFVTKDESVQTQIAVKSANQYSLIQLTL